MFFIININALAEFFSVISVLPLLTAMIEPEVLYKVNKINFLINYFNIKDEKELLLIITFLFVLITFISMLIKLTNSFFVAKISSLIGSDLSVLTYEKIIYQNYEKIVSSNSSKYIAITTKFVSNTVNGINQFFLICSSTIVILLIIAGLLTINFSLTLAIASSLLLLYCFVFLFFKNRISSYGKVSSDLYQISIKYLQESIGAIRDIIINNSQNYFTNYYKYITKRLFIIVARVDFLSAAPRLIIEPISISLIAIAGFIFSNENNNSILPAIGTIAVGSQKLLPAINILYVSIVNIRININPMSSVVSLVEDKNINIKRLNNLRPYNFNNEISLQNIYFKYKKSNKNILKDISFSINKGEKIGIVGETGCGKSTLIDILLHLFKPSQGNLFVDGVNLNEKEIKELIKFRSIISHVPQDVFLIDANFIENIALGFEKKDVDLEKIKLACKCAQIDDFINNCDNGYLTEVGEKGQQLSGGQKQRIGIARALYKESQILILDEATSALDTKTERKVMESINNFNINLTIITIAHRLSTLKNYDRLIYLKNGSVQSIGTPEEIIKLIN